jgi:hypothetical protein
MTVQLQAPIQGWTVASDSPDVSQLFAGMDTGLLDNSGGPANKQSVNFVADFRDPNPITITFSTSSTSATGDGKFYIDPTIINGTGYNWSGFSVQLVANPPTPPVNTILHPSYTHFHDGSLSTWANPQTGVFPTIQGSEIHGYLPAMIGTINREDAATLSGGAFNAGTTQAWKEFGVHAVASDGSSFTLVLTPIFNIPSNQSLFGTVTHDVTSPGGEIYALYQTILGRAPDALGYESWTAQLQAGTSLNTIAQDLLGSSEYTSKYGSYTQSSDSSFVTQLYENGLHRAPDPSGLAAFDAALQPSENRPAIAVDIALSPEARGDLAPVFQAGFPVPSEADSEVARLYYAILGRAPDAAGLAAWESDHAHGDSLANIATDFINSAEYTAKFGAPNNAQFVNALYEGALGRAPDPAGSQSWISALNQGTSRGTIAADIAESPEAMSHLSPQIETGFKLT